MYLLSSEAETLTDEVSYIDYWTIYDNDSVLDHRNAKYILIMKMALEIWIKLTVEKDADDGNAVIGCRYFLYSVRCCLHLPF